MINTKLKETAVTIFSKMSALAQEHKAINLSQGFPDFPSDPRLVELVTKYMQDGKNQYAPMPGVPRLRETLATKINTSYNSDYTPDEITVTPGATYALYTAIACSINPGDEVILFEPAYDCYKPAVEVHGGKVVPIQLNYPNYQIDWELVRSKVSPRTKMIIINNPHNPCGTILKAEDLKALQDITKDTEIVVLSDEVYEHLVFDGMSHESICKYPGLKERSFAVFSFGKTLHVTGWKMGYIVGPSALMKEFRKIHQYLVFSCNHPMQHAIADYITDETTYKSLNNFFEEKRDTFIGNIKNSRLKCLPAEGTYFQLIQYDALGKEGDIKFAERLTKEIRIASIPISVFYSSKLDEKVLRFCFAKRNETLVEAAKILNELQ